MQTKPKSAQSQPRVNDLCAIPFAHILIDLLQAEQTGTLLIYGEPGKVQAAILFEAGMPVAASLESGQDARNLTKTLIPLCAWREGDFLFAQDRNLVGPNAVVAPRPLDPLPLIAAAARGPLRDDAVESTIADIGTNMMRLSPRIDRTRYAFTAQEQPVVACLEAGAIDFEGLRAQAAVPERVLRRMVYVLRLTRAITLLPAARRMVSGTIAHASPLRNVVLDSAQPDTAVSPAPSSPHRHSGPAPSMRGRRAAPMRSAVGSGGRYSVRDPEHGVSELAADHETAAPHGRAEVAHELWERVDALVVQKEFASALLVARSAVKLGTPRAEHEALLGWLMFMHGSAGSRVHPQVWEHFDHAFRRDPHCAQAHYYKALVLRRTGELEQAHVHFKRAVSLKPGHMEALREVRLYQMREDHARQQAGFLHKLLSARSSAKPGGRKR